MKITVIVTVHNAERYLNDCLDSLIAQTFSDIEILCMDGGSTDTSLHILKEYAKKDSRVQIINDPNTSYGHKVNEGIRYAKGMYVAVLESDDMYQPDMLEKLFGIAEQYEADYVNGDYLNIFDINGKRFQEPVKMYPESDYGKLLESSRHPEDMRQILRYWTGLFRRSFLLDNKIQMNESPGASFQDMSFRFLTSALADRAYHLDVPVYLYRVDNPGSSVYDPKKAVVIADEFDFLKRELIKRKIENRYIWQHYYTWKYNDFYGNLLRFDKTARKDLFERCYYELEKDRETLMLFDDKAFSNAIHDFLRKSREQVWEDIEESYRQTKKEENRRYTLLENITDRQIVIFGCGVQGRGLFDYLKSVGADNQVLCFTDNAEELWGTELRGHFILSPMEAIEKYPDLLYVIANKYHGEEINRQLQRLGIKKSNIYKF
ncbi:MAG: glycosyltransferase [Hungatella sp.]|nr:glycosyltransferase [Hungatella sp.]